jgi:hypothetical protein
MCRVDVSEVVVNGKQYIGRPVMNQTVTYRIIRFIFYERCFSSIFSLFRGLRAYKINV